MTEGSPEVIERTVDSIPDADLLARAVRGAAPRQRKQPRWAAVSQVFALGSSFSHQLCRRFGLDPNEMLSPKTTD